MTQARAACFKQMSGHGRRRAGLACHPTPAYDPPPLNPQPRDPNAQRQPHRPARRHRPLGRVADGLVAERAPSQWGCRARHRQVPPTQSRPLSVNQLTGSPASCSGGAVRTGPTSDSPAPPSGNPAPLAPGGMMAAMGGSSLWVLPRPDRHPGPVPLDRTHPRAPEP